MTLFHRLWTYQAERFPLKQVVPLLAVFSAASVTLSAVLAARPLPGIASYLTAFLLVLIVFFQMRVADEVKDHDDDRRFRPERPIPRGLVSLRLIVGLGLGCVPVAVAVALIHGGGVIWLLALVWLWLAAMSVEFGTPAWLKARPVIYLLSHMAIMPLIDLMLTGVEWGAHGHPAPGLWVFIALSFVNGCVLELGRKIKAPQGERAGVETYSALWGIDRALAVWLGLIVGAVILLGVLGALAPGPWWSLAGIGAAGAAICATLASALSRRPGETAAARVDMAAGLWVFLCYAAAGLVPLLFKGLP
ncbi:UbiA family prenyltransferase [Oceaniglobus indicus]|uniref:UbiA family prenyltransferase n=1 Tax=Oceaniglobus indicus TaxID=2047749 RepID=UPI000C17BFE5|nr:UbiA family prenyltransferase [Oceaniglobus indicus]